jgi:hypothetical protein
MSINHVDVMCYYIKLRIDFLKNTFEKKKENIRTRPRYAGHRWQRVHWKALDEIFPVIASYYL